jgi:hypothetical protein
MDISARPLDPSFQNPLNLAGGPLSYLYYFVVQS